MLTQSLIYHHDSFRQTGCLPARRVGVRPFPEEHQLYFLKKVNQVALGCI